jgi:peptidoglycan/xylan/chitin deacetylase (PgdA/CDA1 family)
MSDHLAYLSRRYHFISLTDAVNAILTKTTGQIPSKSLVITIDDGHAGNFDLLDIFKRYRVKPTIYLSSHIIGTHRHFWSTMVKEPASFYKNISLDHFLSCVKRDYAFSPDREYSTRQALNHQEIAEMEPWVDFQCHGRYHFNLTICDDDTANTEIVDSNIKLQKIINRTCAHFAYPFGDYSSRDVTLVKSSGYKSGRTVDPGINDENSDPYRLKAIAMIPDNASLHMLCAQISGLPNFFEYWLPRIIKRVKRLMI